VICFWCCCAFWIFIGLLTILSCVFICTDINLSKSGCVFGNYLVVISSCFFALSMLASSLMWCEMNIWSKCPGFGAVITGVSPLVFHILAFLFYDRSCIGDQWYYSWWIFLIYITILMVVLLCCLIGCFCVLGKDSDLNWDVLTGG
jgi:hypothetical protein